MDVVISGVTSRFGVTFIEGLGCIVSTNVFDKLFLSFQFFCELSKAISLSYEHDYRK